jgi:hypothetical protein
MGEFTVLQGFNGSNILEVAIGLIFVFMLVSLFVSWVQETIASIFSLRSKHMIEIIQVLLDPEGEDAKAFETEGLRNKISGIPSTQQVKFVKKFYGSALVKSLSKPKEFPSYVDPGDFANYVLDYVLEADLDDVPAAGKKGKKGKPKKINIKDQLRAIETQVDQIADPTAKKAIMSQVKLAWKANDTVDKRIAATRENVMGWFNTTMDRAQGWYKRRAQKIAFWIGLIVVIVLNIDTFGMAWSFYNEPQLREFVIQEATTKFDTSIPQDCEGKSGADFSGCLETAQSSDPAIMPQECIKSTTENELTTCMLDAQSTALLNQIDDLPIGWTLALMNSESDSPNKIDYDPNRIPPFNSPTGWFYWLLKIFGLLVTAYAVSFGAPFWFELLNKFVNMRLSGKKPESKESK